MILKYLRFLAVCCLVGAAPALAQINVDVDLGVLGVGDHSIVGDTTGAGNEVSNYPPFTNPLVTWLEDYVYQFTITTDMQYQLLNNSIAGDADFFLLDSLGTTFDGTHNLANSTLAADFLDGGANGAVLGLPANTYYLVVDAFGGALPGNSAANVGPFDVTMRLSPPPIASSLGLLPLDDGFYARGGTGDPDHPYGQLAFTVDTTGAYDIRSDWLAAGGGSFDGYLFLFDAPFTGDDSTNIAFDDDFGGLDASLIEGVNLIAGQTYYLMGTTFAGMPGVTTHMGDITVFGPGTATLIPEPSSTLLALLALCGMAAVIRRK